MAIGHYEDKFSLTDTGLPAKGAVYTVKNTGTGTGSALTDAAGALTGSSTFITDSHGNGGFYASDSIGYDIYDGGGTKILSDIRVVDLGGGGGGASFGTPSITLGTAAAAGIAASTIRSDATITAFDATAPITQAFGDTAAVGTAPVAARRDHKHGMPARAQAETVKNTDAQYTSQMVFPILTGSFTPNGTSGWLSVAVTGQARGPDFAALDCVWGTPAPPLWVAHQGDALATGVSQFRVGDINNDTLGSASKRKLLTGLTPGTTYNWQVLLGIVSGSGSDAPVGSHPHSMAFEPNGRRLWVTNNGDGTVHVINVGYNQPLSFLNGLAPLDSYAGLVAVGAGPQGIAVTPDGTKVIVCNSSGSSVTVINTSDLSVQGTYTMPGTTPIPAQVACLNSTTAYITDYQNAKVYPFTIASGAFGTAVTVGANPLGLAFSPDGTRLCVANYSGNTVSVLNSPFTSVAATLTPTGTTPGPSSVAAMPNSSAFWVSLANAGGLRLQEVLIPGNTLGVQSETTTDTGLGGSGGGLKIDPDGLSAWAAANNGTVDQFTVVGPPLANTKGTKYVVAPISPSTKLNGVAIDPLGGVFLTDDSGSRVWKYPGTQVVIYDTSSVSAKFANEDCTVTWEDA